MECRPHLDAGRLLQAISAEGVPGSEPTWLSPFLPPPAPGPLFSLGSLHTVSLSCILSGQFSPLAGVQLFTGPVSSQPFMHSTHFYCPITNHQAPCWVLGIQWGAKGAYELKRGRPVHPMGVCNRSAETSARQKKHVPLGLIIGESEGGRRPGRGAGGQGCFPEEGEMKLRYVGEGGVDRAGRRRNSWFKGPVVGAGQLAGRYKVLQAVAWKQRPGCIAPRAKSNRLCDLGISSIPISSSAAKHH